MPRTAVTPTALVANTGIDRPSGTTIDATLVTNGVTIANADLERLILEVSNTAGSAKIVTVQSGDDPPAEHTVYGDLTDSVALTSGVVVLGPFTGARFSQSDGALEVDFESGFTGTFRAYQLPRKV